MEERTDQKLLEPEEIDALRTRVAENLGWRNLSYNSGGVLLGIPPGQKKLSVVPSYGRDIKAAWEIVDFLANRGFRTQIEVKIFSPSLRTYIVEIGDHKTPISRVLYVWPAAALCMAFELAIPVVLKNTKAGYL